MHKIDRFTLLDEEAEVESDDAKTAAGADEETSDGDSCGSLKEFIDDQEEEEGSCSRASLYSLLRRAESPRRKRRAVLESESDSSEDEAAAQPTVQRAIKVSKHPAPFVSARTLHLQQSCSSITSTSSTAPGVTSKESKPACAAPVPTKSGGKYVEEEDAAAAGACQPIVSSVNFGTKLYPCTVCGSSMPHSFRVHTDLVTFFDTTIRCSKCGTKTME